MPSNLSLKAVAWAALTIVVLALALVVTLVLTPRPGKAQGACNPVGAPVGSIGCQPAFASASGSDLLLLWRPSMFPNALGQVNLQQLSAYVMSAPTKLPTACTGLVTGTLWNNAGTVQVCP